MSRFFFLVVALLCVLPQCAWPGKLFARKPGTASPIYNLRQIDIQSSITIMNLLAITHVDERFLNSEATEVEAWYVFQLPENAVMDGLWLWVDGERITCTVRRKDAAQAEYDSLAQKDDTYPAILETLGAHRFQMRMANIKPGQIRRIEIRYFQQLSTHADGLVRYRYPLNMSGYQSIPVERLSLRIDLDMDRAIDLIRTNADDRPLAVSSTMYGDRRAVVTFGGEYFLENKDFLLEYAVTGRFDSISVLTHSETQPPNSSFFLLAFADTMQSMVTGAMDVVFAIDASASMTGLRSEHVLTALNRLLDALEPYDRFRIVFFNDELLSYPSDTSMVFADHVSLSLAKAVISQHFLARGTTRYDHVLHSLSTLAFRSESDRRCVFITDGHPTHGLRTHAELLPYLRYDNDWIRFFPLTIFTENTDMLATLARSSDGMLTVLEQGDNIEDVLRRITFSFGSAVVRDVVATYPSGVNHVYERITLPQMNEISYTASGCFVNDITEELSVSIKRTATGDVVRHKALRLQRDVTTPVQIARLWASHRIQELLEDLEDSPNDKSIQEEIIRISERYMILTPFTAFLVYKPRGGDLLEARGELASPATMTLHQGYPNPFREHISITYSIDVANTHDVVLLRIFDIRGRCIRVLVNEFVLPGIYSTFWDGRDESGLPVPSGVYRCVLQRGDQYRTISLMLIR